jgi:hypothetical protein
MNRRRLILLALMAGLGLGLLWWWNKPIDHDSAARIADRLAQTWLVRSGAQPQAFLKREDQQWADGWEFRWRYRACPDYASLRVWISRNGRRASLAEVPDCQPVRGFSGVPLKT